MQSELEGLGEKRRVMGVVLIVVAGFYTSVCFHYAMASYVGLPYPHNTFLFNPADRFNDFFNIVRGNAGLNPYFGPVASTAYPFLNAMGFVLSLIPQRIGFLGFVLAQLCAVGWLVSRYARLGSLPSTGLSVFALTFMTYPVLFTLDRGNFEGIVFVCVLAFTYCYERRRLGLASMFLGCAIALKMFPALLLALFVADRRYRHAAAAVAIAVGLTMGSLALFQGGFVLNLGVLVRGGNVVTNPFLAGFLGNNNVVQRGVTLFTFGKVVAIKAGWMGQLESAGGWLRIYVRIAALLGVAMTAYVVFVERVLWRRVAVLTAGMLLLPHLSADYKLIHVLVPALMFMSAMDRSRWDVAYVVLFGALLIPKDYVLLQGVRSDGGADISIGVLLNPLILMLLSGLVVSEGLAKATKARLRMAFLRQWTCARALLGLARWARRGRESLA